MIDKRVLLFACVVVAGACSMPSAMAQPTQAGAAAREAVRDLPLEWVAPIGPARAVTAVLMTGDGGWAELIRSIGNGLAEQGIAVVGFNSRRWLSSVRTPEKTAEAVVRAIDAARAQWPGNELVLIGYSRGADFAPFVANRLPPRLATQVRGIALFGLAPYSSFEFHYLDLVKDTRRDTDLPIGPELEKLRGVPMVCVYGRDEPTSGCRDAPADLVSKDEREGGHHFDGNVDALVAHVLRLLEPRPQS